MQSDPVSGLPPITLGTVQLGLPYGLGAARAGIDASTAEKILDAAWAGGIRCFDTGRAYGEAENRIGRWLERRMPRPSPIVVSKFPKLGEIDPTTEIRRSLDASLGALGLERIDVYLAHHGLDLLRAGVIETLRRFVGEGRIGGFGGSIYEAAEAAAILEIPGLTAIQLPLSLANMEAAESGLLDRTQRCGISIFVRSVFLQGLLISDPLTLDPFFRPVAPLLERLDALARDADTTRAALAIAAVRSTPGISSIVVGVDNEEQLEASLVAFRQRPSDDAIKAALAIGRQFPSEIADPRRWQR